MPFVFRYFLSLLMITALAIGFAEPTFAQPVQGNDDQAALKRLQQELQQLQNRMSQKRSSQSSDRVRSVGDQSIKRYAQPLVEEVLQIRLYDLSDLFVVSPSYPAPYPLTMPHDRAMAFAGSAQVGQGQGGGGFGGAGGGGVFRLPPRPPTANPKQFAGNVGEVSDAQVTIPRLTQAIKKTVAPTKWGDGDADAKLEMLGNTLLITATDDMHAQINSLLNLFREHWGKRRTISVQTFWIEGNILDANELVDQESQEQLGAGIVTKDDFETYLKEAHNDSRIVFSATLTGHNNQTLHTFSGRKVAKTIDGEMITNRTKSYDEEGELTDRGIEVIGFKPIQAALYEGPIFQTTPLATRGGNYVILDLHAQLNSMATHAKASTTTIAAGGNANIPELKLDVAEQSIARFSTTLRCPKNQVVLAGSMTASKDDEKQNLLIFVKTLIHTIEEDESDWFESQNVAEDKAATPTKETMDDKLESGDPDSSGELEGEAKE
ncbi:MAG: hypothetical protein AAFN77_20310 [Planctomycetota bacterium]